jgi:hypothetical protein
MMQKKKRGRDAATAGSRDKMTTKAQAGLKTLKKQTSILISRRSAW